MIFARNKYIVKRNIWVLVGFSCQSTIHQLYLTSCDKAGDSHSNYDSKHFRHHCVSPQLCSHSSLRRAWRNSCWLRSATSIGCHCWYFQSEDRGLDIVGTEGWRGTEFDSCSTAAPVLSQVLPSLLRFSLVVELQIAPPGQSQDLGRPQCHEVGSLILKY